MYSTKHMVSPSPRKQSPGMHGQGGHKSGVNIMADLAVQTNKRNLLVGGGSSGNAGGGSGNFSPHQVG